MRQLSFAALRTIREQDDDWVEKAKNLVEDLKEDKERQLRIIQSMAESSRSWDVVKLFMRYQAARSQIDRDWTENAVSKLESLQNDARTMAAKSTSKDNVKDLHMELVSRVLGYAVRWHVWDNDIKKRKVKGA